MSIVMINVRKKMQKIAVVEMFGTIGGQIKSPDDSVLAQDSARLLCHVRGMRFYPG